MPRHTTAFVGALFWVVKTWSVNALLRGGRLHDQVPDHGAEANGRLHGGALDHEAVVNGSRKDVGGRGHIGSRLNGSVRPSESAGGIAERLGHETKRLDHKTVRDEIAKRVAGRIVGREQEHAERTYCDCNSTACSVDQVKVKDELPNDLVLILGCSLDIFAIEYFCAAVGVAVKEFKTKNKFSYLSHCDVGGFTIAYAFHPGAAPQPYYSEYAGTATTATIVQNSVYDVKLQFGREPTAIVVDSSLWDVSNWWQKAGKPPGTYPIPSADIFRWCTHDVPQLLNWVQTQYPHSGVAFRTPPTVFPGNGYGQRPGIIDEMVQCVEQHIAPNGAVYGKYAFIDYHNFVDHVLQHAPGSPMQMYYKDSLHPGPQLSLMYMNKVLNWAKSLH